MRRRRLVFSDASIADILEQAEWYAAQSGRRLARRWENAVTSAVSLIARRPAAGAPCKFRPPDLQDVRRTTISDSPNICSSTDSTMTRYSYFELYTAHATWNVFFLRPGVSAL